MKICVIILYLIICCNLCAVAQFKYPVARKEKFDTTIYDKKISDEYFWMSRPENKNEMLAFSKQQGQLTQATFDSIPGSEAIENDLGEAYAALQDDVWNMRTQGANFYYYRDIPEEGTWLCRRKTMNAPEEKMLSKVMINGQKYSVRKRMYAPNHPLLALMLTQAGEANPQIRIFDLDKKEFCRIVLVRLCLMIPEGFLWPGCLMAQDYFIHRHLPQISAAKNITMAKLNYISPVPTRQMMWLFLGVT